MKVDYAFKYVMRNKNVMKGFLSAVLGVDKKEIKEIEYLDTNTEKDGEESKLGIMDLLVSMNGSSRINIEIQLYYMGDWLNRSLFYLCEEYITGFRSGKGYGDSEIPSVICINILDFTILKNEKWVYNTYKIMNPRSHNVLTDKIDIHIIELSKLKDLSEAEKKKHREVIKWAGFIAAETWKEYEIFGREDADMAEAVKELKKINADEIERLRYLHREIAMRDEYQRKVDEEKRKKEFELKEEWMKQKEEWMKQKEEEIKAKEEEVKEKEGQVREKEGQVREKEEQVKEKEEQIREKEQRIKEIEEQITVKETFMKDKEEMINNRIEIEKNSMMDLLEKITEGMTREEILKQGYLMEDIERMEKIIRKDRQEL